MRSAEPMSRSGERLSKSAQNGVTCGQKLGTLRKNQPANNSLPAPSDMQQDFPPVIAAARSPEQTVEFETIDEFHCAVVPDLEPFGQNAHGWRATDGQSLDRQQGLKLLWLDTGMARGVLGQIQEAAELVTELRERAVIEFRFQCKGSFRNQVIS